MSWGTLGNNVGCCTKGCSSEENSQKLLLSLLHEFFYEKSHVQGKDSVNSLFWLTLPVTHPHVLMAWGGDLCHHTHIYWQPHILTQWLLFKPYDPLTVHIPHQSPCPKLQAGFHTSKCFRSSSQFSKCGTVAMVKKGVCT